MEHNEFKITRYAANSPSFVDETEVYGFIIEYVFDEFIENCSYQAYKEAKEAENWCKTANIGDEYIGNDFSIKRV